MSIYRNKLLKSEDYVVRINGEIVEFSISKTCLGDLILCHEISHIKDVIQEISTFPEIYKIKKTSPFIMHNTFSLFMTNQVNQN